MKTHRIDDDLNDCDDRESKEESELAANLGHKARHRRGEHFANMLVLKLVSREKETNKSAQI